MSDPAQIVVDPKIAAAIKDLDELTKKPTEKMADVVEEVEEEQEDFQAMYNAGGHFKEQMEAIVKGWGTRESETVMTKEKKVSEVGEIPENVEVEKHKELEGYVEKVERDPERAKAAVADYVKQVGMGAGGPTNPKITIPLTDDQIKLGLHHKVWEAIRWLAEWCVRRMKMLR